MVLYHSQAMVERFLGPGILVEDIIKQSIARRPPPCSRSITLVLNPAAPVRTTPPPVLPDDKTTGRFMRREYLSGEQMKLKKSRATTIPRPSIGAKGGYIGRVVRRDDLGPPEQHIIQEKLIVVMPRHTDTSGLPRSFHFAHQNKKPTVVTVVKTIVEPIEEPEVEPVAMEPVAEPRVELEVVVVPVPITEPIVEPTVEPTAEPIAEPTAEPTAEPPVEPTVEPITKPEAVVAEPTIEPVVTTSTTSKTWASLLAKKLADENGLLIDDIPSSSMKVTIREVRRKLAK